MSDELFALILTLALFVLLAVWAPILDLLRDAVRDFTIGANPAVSKDAVTELSAEEPAVRPVGSSNRKIRDDEFFAVGERLRSRLRSTQGMPGNDDGAEQEDPSLIYRASRRSRS